MYKIVYQNLNNTISIITPNPIVNINVVAKKDVPKGLKYKLVPESVIPTNRTFRSAWRTDFSSFDGIGEGPNYDLN